MAVATAARAGLQQVARTIAPRAAPAALDLESVQERERARAQEERDVVKAAQAEAQAFSFGNPQWKQPLNKSFDLYLGAQLNLPCADKRVVPATETPNLTPQDAASSPFEGLPLLSLAERLGERVAPVYQEIKRAEKEAQREGKAKTQAAQVWDVPVPHFLPITKMAVAHPEFKKTFVFDEANRKTARLSWYHPDDTMVPRDWLQGGLIADLKYYFDFRRS